MDQQFAQQTDIDGTALNANRRQFLERSGVGLGSVALMNLLAGDAHAERAMQSRSSQYGPRAKNVIYLFMAGGPSQLELFSPKPVLKQYHQLRKRRVVKTSRLKNLIAITAGNYILESKITIGDGCVQKFNPFRSYMTRW